MRSELEIKSQALAVLLKELGSFDTERFIALIKRENFDYTIWRSNLPQFASVEDLSRRAMDLRRNANPS